MTDSSKKPRWFYGLAALSGPLLFFLGLELILRLTGFGGDYPLFRDFDDLPGFRVVNDQVMNRYLYGGEQPIASPDPFLFPADRAEGSVRIVVQGGSSAAGFPYGRWGGLAGMLDTRIEQTDPELAFEVIGTAMAAVNSYTLIDFADEIVEVEPDAVLVYAGHNEFLGVLGVGSSLDVRSSQMASRIHLMLQPFRVYQLADRIAALVRRGAGTEGEGGPTSLFEQAASGAKIPFDSEAYHAGLAQFETNLSILLSKYQSADIPVYIGTLVSNESHLMPFDGGPGAAVDPEVWRILEEKRLRYRRENSPDAEREILVQMLALDGESADAWFELGQLEALSGNEGGAQTAFGLARDYDRLRFRAPSDFNEIIRKVSREYGAHVVEVRARFIEHSSNGLVGDQWMLEHVHPNSEGYWLLAEAFYQALMEGGVLRIPENHQRAPVRAPLLNPLTRVDQLVAEYRVQEMKSRYPFVETPVSVRLPEPDNEVEELALRYHDKSISWIEMMEALLQIHLAEGRLEEAARVARLTAREYPTDAMPNLVAGLLWIRIEDFARGRLYLDRAYRAAPEETGALAALVQLDQREGRSGEPVAKRRIDLAEQSPGHPALRTPLNRRSRSASP